MNERPNICTLADVDAFPFFHFLAIHILLDRVYFENIEIFMFVSLKRFDLTGSSHLAIYKELCGRG